MELTLDQALQKGIEAHKAGNVQEADRYYTAILKANPKHPDANHNMGVLAVGVGKVTEALPFFNTALEVNPKIDQFWLSYIDALIKLNRIEDAKVVFDQAKENGARGDGFGKLELRLSTSLVKIDNQIPKDNPTRPNILDKINLNKALKLAKKKAKDGLSEEAKKIYKDILEKFPKNKKALDGVRTLASKTLANTSGMGDPPGYQLQSLINLYTQGQHQQALEKASQLLNEFSSSVTLYNIIGAANKSLGKLDEGIEAFKKALSLKPDFAEASYNIGIILKDQGKLEEATKAYKKALSLKPDFAEASYNMGIALKDQGKLDEAIEAFKKALSFKPDFAEAYNNMGMCLKEQGKLEEAIEAYNKALSRKPNYAEAYYNIGNALKGITFNKPNWEVQKAIVSLLDKERYIRPSEIARAAISLLKLEPNLRKNLQLIDTQEIESPLDVVSDLSELPLLLKLMTVCPLPDFELEKLLKDLRNCILANISVLKDASPELLGFQSALALQCFTNEYLYSHTEEEEKILKSLENSVRLDLNNNEQPSPQLILALASYKSLNQYDWSKLLIVTDHIKDVFNRQFEEPYEEEKLKRDLPILKEITDSISSEVRAQYEESPYPRWVNLGLALKPISISEMANEIKLKLEENIIAEVKNPDILIAGCGTGQQSIGTATYLKSSKVLAIDLSLSSLAYAKRKTDELGIENIKYMQADILDLNKLNRKFDIIESAGVLHHMKNPMAGWRVLTDCLKPGGLMYIGLYSELARQPIVKMRQEISKAGIGSSDAAMKSFRNKILRSDKAHYKLIKNSGDFYSLSTLKDLLFHVQEHRFTIPQIKDFLDKLGLKFCGFEAPQIVSHFQQKNRDKNDPYDLEKWQTYEKENAGVFAGMYQFWCQKVDRD